MSGRTPDGRIDHIDMNVRIGRGSIAVGSGVRVILRFLQVLLLHDFLALDHAVAAVRAIILAFFTPCAAAGAVLIVLDFGAGDLLLVLCGALALTSEAKSSSDPAYELEDNNDRHYK